MKNGETKKGTINPACSLEEKGALLIILISIIFPTLITHKADT